MNVSERHLPILNHRIRPSWNTRSGRVCVCVCVCMCVPRQRTHTHRPGGSDPGHSLGETQWDRSKIALLIVKISYPCTICTIHCLTNRGLLAWAVYSVKQKKTSCLYLRPFRSHDALKTYMIFEIVYGPVSLRGWTGYICSNKVCCLLK